MNHDTLFAQVAAAATAVLSLWVCSGAAAAQDSKTTAGESSIDLLDREDSWSTWAPRPEIQPEFSKERGAGPGGQTVLAVAATGNPAVCGCWQRSLPALKQGRRYRIEAMFRCEGEIMPSHCVWAVVTDRVNNKQRWRRELDVADSAGAAAGGRQRGWTRLAAEIQPAKDTDSLSLRLYLAWSSGGRVLWSDVWMTEMTEQPKPRRLVRLAAVSGSPNKASWSGDPIGFYCQRLDEVGGQEVDLACLPEVINSSPEPIPGPSSKRLADKARQYRMYVAASLRERDGECNYNAGILLDRSGKLVGKYRKTHLAPGEGLLDGYTPGDSYPVFQTEFGAVGYMICYDYHFPEVARILAVQGADIILLSNMGDGREGGALWAPCIRTRALDNNVHIVASVNGGRSCIVSPKGEILSMVDETPGAIASAMCDLDTSVANFSGRPIGDRYQRFRRNDTYGPLMRHRWEIMKERRDHASSPPPPVFGDSF